jgi:hypothetical protein
MAAKRLSIYYPADSLPIQSAQNEQVLSIEEQQFPIGWKCRLANLKLQKNEADLP